MRLVIIIFKNQQLIIEFKSPYSVLHHYADSSNEAGTFTKVILMMNSKRSVIEVKKKYCINANPSSLDD